MKKRPSNEIAKGVRITRIAQVTFEKRKGPKSELERLGDALRMLERN